MTEIEKAAAMRVKRTARQELGDVIRHHREQREWNIRRTANVCGTNQATVEAWEAGRSVPTSREWEALQRTINRQFRYYGDLYKSARSEDEAERSHITGAISMHTNGVNNRATLGASLGERMSMAAGTDKAPIVVAPKPIALVRGPTPTEPPREEPKEQPTMTEPTSRRTPGSGRVKGTPMPQFPPGSRTDQAIAARDEFVRNVLRMRPAIKYGGDDGLGALLHQRFGIGVTPARVDVIRAEVQLERASANTTGSHAPVAAPVKAAASAPAPAQAPTNEADLETAVGIVLDAIPGLRSFTITVDDEGHAQVDYTVREVKITERGGSIKVKRG